MPGPALHITSDSDLESVISAQDVAAKPKTRRDSAGPKYTCTVEKDCGATFKRLDQLDRHEYHHTGIKKHICVYEDCNKAYSIVTHLKRHVRATHERTVKEVEKSIACSVPDCKKKFTTVSNMHRHVREAHEHPKVYECKDCDAKFSQKVKMRRHVIQMHTYDYPFVCDKCERGFFQRWQHDAHVPKCKVYPCPDCELQFNKWTLYVGHCRESNHGRKYYKCDFCDQSYGKPSELQQHVAAKHLSVDEDTPNGYPCTQTGCTRAYAYERNLRQHIKIAHDGKGFSCVHPGCTSQFSSSQNLAKHVANIHDASKPVKRRKETNSVAVKRKKRKDAGQPAVSHLVKLSGLEVDKDTDKLLRMREEQTVADIADKLVDEEHECSTDVTEDDDNTGTDIANRLVDELLDPADKMEDF